MGGSRALVPVLHGAAFDRPDEADTAAAAEAVAAALARLGYDAPIQHLGLNLSSLELLQAERPLCVFNLVDAIDGDCRLAPLAPLALEHLGLPFTGGGSAAWLSTLSKMQTKRALQGAGLPTPDWWDASNVQRSVGTVIVKADIEHGSLGMDETSVCDAAHAADAMQIRATQFRTPFFAETYVAGREFNAALIEHGAEIRVLPIAEIDFHDLATVPRIVGYDAKWSESSAAYIGTPRRFGLEEREPELAERLTALSSACWRLFDLRGYARIDFRVDAGGSAHILEVNVNPCLTPGAGFAATAEQAALSYDTMVEAIVAAALHA